MILGSSGTPEAVGDDCRPARGRKPQARQGQASPPRPARDARSPPPPKSSSRVVVQTSTSTTYQHPLYAAGPHLSALAPGAWGHGAAGATCDGFPTLAESVGSVRNLLRGTSPNHSTRTRYYGNQLPHRSGSDCHAHPVPESQHPPGRASAGVCTLPSSSESTHEHSSTPDGSLDAQLASDGGRGGRGCHHQLGTLRGSARYMEGCGCRCF